MLTESLDVCNQVPGGVRAQIGCLFTGVRPASATATLIKKYDAITCRIEQAPQLGMQPSTRPTVQEDCRLACRVPALLPIDLLAVTDIQHPAGVRLDRWIQRVGTSLPRHCD